MQVKKEIMKEQILDAGYKIFSEVGYEKASLRRITKEAGTTIGNYYNYFENKEALFDALVGQAYEQFNDFLNHHEEESGHHGEILDEETMIDLMKDGLPSLMASILPIFTPKFLLLIDRSQGTKYASFKTSLIDFFEEHYLEHVREVGNKHGQSIGADVNQPYGRILSELFVEGLIKVVRTYMGQEVLGQQIGRHFMFFAIGTMGLLKTDEKGREA